MKIKTKDDRRVRIQLRQRKRIAGTKERPRLSVFRSVTHIYAQVIDDLTGQTLVSASTVEPSVKGAFDKAVARRQPEGRRGDRQGDRRALDRKGHQARRVRSQRLPVSRAHPRRGGRRAQSRSGVLEDMRTRERIDPSQLDIKDTVVSINRVTKVVKGGKNLSFSALVVVGDGHGVVGFGIGKAKEVPSAIKKGIEAAKKNLIRVPLRGRRFRTRSSATSARAACCSSRRRTARASSRAARCARSSRPRASRTS